MRLDWHPLLPTVLRALLKHGHGMPQDRGFPEEPGQAALGLLRYCLFDKCDFVMLLLLALGHRHPLVVPSWLIADFSPIGSGGVCVRAPCPHPLLEPWRA